MFFNEALLKQMKQWLYYSFPLFLFSYSHGQNITRILLKQNTKIPIPFAKIYAPDLKTGTISNEKGQFYLHGISTVFSEDKQGNYLPLIPQSKLQSTISAEKITVLCL